LKKNYFLRKKFKELINKCQILFNKNKDRKKKKIIFFHALQAGFHAIQAGGSYVGGGSCSTYK
jgi:hypothetical protein